MASEKTAYERVCQAMSSPEARLKIREVARHTEGIEHVVKVNGKRRIEGYITFLMAQYEQLKAVDPSLPAVMPPHCFEPEFIARFFGLPLSETEIASDEPGHLDDCSCLELQQRMTVAIERIADQLAPAPPDIVGTPYIATKLGYSTAWITDLIRKGEIPRSSIVNGSGNGRPWKFYRHRIDEWIEHR